VFSAHCPHDPALNRMSRILNTAAGSASPPATNPLLIPASSLFGGRTFLSVIARPFARVLRYFTSQTCSQCETTVDREHIACHIRRPFAGKEQNGICDVVGLAETPCRDLLRDRFFGRVANRLGHVRGDKARSNRI